MNLSGLAKRNPERGFRDLLAGCFRRYSIDMAVAGLIVSYVWRLWVVHSAVPAARVFHDTKFYFQVAENGILSRDMWAGGRAPLPCLMFKLCGVDAERIRRSLTVVSATSWSLLAWAISRSVVVPWLRVAGTVLVVTLALSIDVIQWNEALLSESVSCSLMVLFVAAALMFLERRGMWSICVGILAGALVLCRDSNAYFILLIGSCILGDAARKFRKGVAWKMEATLSVAFFGWFLLSNSSANAGVRWEYPLTNVIVSRVLPDKEMAAEFKSLGMPVSPALRPHRARRDYDSDPRLEPFRQWIESHGKGSYIRFLSVHPGYVFSQADFSALLGASLINYRANGAVSGEPSIGENMWGRESWLWRVGLIVLICFACVFLRMTRSSLVKLGMVLAFLVYPHGLVIWHGDSMEVPRHGLPVAFQLQLALLLLLVGLGDRLSYRVKFPKRLPVE